MDWLTVAEAAARLGISQDAVRQRIRRDTIEHKKDEADGRVYVFVSPTNTPHDGVQDAVHDGDPYGTVRDDLVEELRERVRFLETELEDRKEEGRRKDHLLAAAIQRIPELEPASEPRDGHETASEERGNGASSATQEDDHRSWWQRLFGL